MKHPDFLLIIAGSGRMLAEAAGKAGLRALVLDLYGDSDTRFHAFDLRRLPSLAVEYAAPALDELAKRYGVGQAVYGSGLECHPETLDYLSRRMSVLGNSPAVFRRVQNKAEFFAALAALRIPFPRVSWRAPEDGCEWLVKPMQGLGGGGIRRFRRGDGLTDDGVYWQRFQDGVPGSVLFLADTRAARTIGFHTQFTAELDAGLEFVFSGLINRSSLSGEQRARVAGWLDRCVQCFALKGLNSLDFIHDGERVYALEINPRPSASMQLYEDLLIRHIEACRGGLPDKRPAQAGFAGFRIVYSDRDFRVPDAFAWPDWTMDRPDAGALCRAGQPVCSVMSCRSEPSRAEAELAARAQQIFNQLIKV